MSRPLVLVSILAIASLGAIGFALAGEARGDGPLARKVAPRAETPPPKAGAKKAWTETPDGRRQWRNGDTTVTVSGSLTVETAVGSGTGSRR